MNKKLLPIALTAFLLGLILVIMPISSEASVRVRGYFRKDGTYVQPHYRSNPDGNPYNNYSFPGNTNPYTGETATGNPTTYLNNYYGTNNGTNFSGTISVPSIGAVLGTSSIPGFVSSLEKMRHEKINALFRYVSNGRNPTPSENKYWLTRLVDKPLVGDMLGAMQWHQIHGIKH